MFRRNGANRLLVWLTIVSMVYVVNLRSIANYFYPMKPDLRPKGVVCGGWAWSEKNGHAFQLFGIIHFVVPRRK